MISTTSAFQGLEGKGQGSILASPALYKDEQNGAPGQNRWVGSVGGAVVWVGEPESEEGSRLERESCGGQVRVEGECQSVERAPK